MKKDHVQKRIVALAGNPNVGKSTLFNTLTGLHQHTGNWPGKTVGVARGSLKIRDAEYELIDLPGTYALSGSSEDERIAAEFIASGEADCTVIVCDGSCLERTLILALQILSLTQRAVVCVNLMDEAERNGVFIDGDLLSKRLGVSVVLTSAGNKAGIDGLLRHIDLTVDEAEGKCRVCIDPIKEAQQIANECAAVKPSNKARLREKAESILVNRRFGIPMMFLLLLLIIWLTVWGANYPSALLGRLFDGGYRLLKRCFSSAPAWLSGLIVDGMYATAARVISVMLPPMAIFFPLFTVLEDVGYLPRMAFLLDGCMHKCGGCGKQALTMCMGLGCNAVGVTGCRIIESPRERVQAILTNAMIPCNGRFPTLIALGTLFFPDVGAALIVAGSVALGMLGAMVTSGALSKTVLRHEQSVFLMEIPPLRRPRFGQILVRSLLDRTLHISVRALKVAVPAGGILWLMANTQMLSGLSGILNPFGRLLGMSGVIMVAFLFSFPANELFIPVLLMLLSGASDLQSVANIGADYLGVVGWSWKTVVCVMIFTLFHWPCATTLMTVHKETGSKIETAAAFILPTAVGMFLCLILNLILSVF